MLKVYITDLAAYNNGYLIGNWIRLPIEKEELSQKIKQILNDGSKACGYGESHEEWFITDYDWENGICLVEVAEYEDVYALNEKIRQVEHLTSDELKVIQYLITENIATDIEDALSKVDDVVVYVNQTMEDIATTLLADLYDLDDLPPMLVNNIDYEGIARDLEIEGGYTVIGSDVFEYSG